MAETRPKPSLDTPVILLRSTRNRDARAGIPTIRIDHVEVEDLLAASPDAGLDFRFFDVHVEGIQQRAKVDIGVVPRTNVIRAFHIFDIPS